MTRADLEWRAGKGNTELDFFKRAYPQRTSYTLNELFMPKNQTFIGTESALKYTAPVDLGFIDRTRW